MTQFRVIIGKDVKPSKDMEITEAIEMLTSVRQLFRASGRDKSSYSLRFADLVDGSSDIVFMVETDKENTQWNILPSYDISKTCLDFFKNIKASPEDYVQTYQNVTGLKKFFATSRKIKYDITVQINESTTDSITFSQQQSAYIYNTYTQNKNLRTIICKARIVAIDIPAKHIKLDILKSDTLKVGEVIKPRVNAQVLDHCIKHDIQIHDEVEATIEVELQSKKPKVRLLNIYSKNINGLHTQEV